MSPTHTPTSSQQMAKVLNLLSGYGRLAFYSGQMALWEMTEAVRGSRECVSLTELVAGGTNGSGIMDSQAPTELRIMNLI